MIFDLIQKIWKNEKYHTLAQKLELEWFRNFLSTQRSEPELTVDEINKLLRAAVIVACSENSSEKMSAYKIATQVSELYPSDTSNAIARIVLTRVANLPAISTRKEIDNSGHFLPDQIAMEEVTARKKYTVRSGQRDLVLTSFQHKLWSQLDSGRSIALSAPTSAGKSFVVQQFIASTIQKTEKKHALYVVPTRALISQVSQDIREILANVEGIEVLTMPPEKEISIPNKSIFVLTQERTQLLLEYHANYDPDIVIVDEAQNMQDGSRGVLLQWAIDELISRPSKKQTLFASPPVSNLNVFSNVFDIDNIETVSSVDPSVSQNFVLVRVTKPTRGQVDFFSLDIESGKESFIGTKSLDRKLSSKSERLLGVAAAVGVSGPCIVYSDGPKTAETRAIALSNMLTDYSTSIESSNLIEDSDLAKFAREIVHEKYALADCLNAGVGYHYGVMPASLRLAIENAFKTGLIKYLVCTTTLLQGVNLPAKNMILCHPKKGKKEHIQGVDFWNLVGRAGRLLKDFHGNIFLVDYDNWEQKPLKQPRAQEIRFTTSKILADNEIELTQVIEGERISLSGLEGIEETFTRLFSDFQQGKAHQSLMNSTGGDDAKSHRILNSLSLAADLISIPTNVIKQSGGVSPHRLQSLKQILVGKLESLNGDFSKLIPKHPRDTTAYNSFSEILKICRREILGVSDEKHSFHAIISLRWMQGWPLPRIIDDQIKRHPEKKPKDVIYDTLDVVEREIRFKVNQMFASYVAVLSLLLEENNKTEDFDSIPPLSLYLEVGACDQTTISLMSIGVSRPVALKLTDVAPRKDMDIETVLRWIQRAPRTLLNLSPFMEKEIDVILSARVFN